MALFRQYLDLLMRVPGDRRRLGVLVVLMTVAAGLEAVGVGLVMPFVALLQRPELAGEWHLLHRVTEFFGIRTNAGAIIFVGASLLCVFVVKNLYLAGTLYLQMRFIYNRMTIFSCDLLSAYLSRSYPFFLQRNSAELVRNVVNDASMLFYSAMPSWFVVVVETITCLVLAALLVILEPVAVPVVTLILVGGGYLFQRYYRRRVATFGEELRVNETALVKQASQAFGGIKEVLVRGCESVITASFADASRKLGRSMRTHRTVVNFPRFVFETLAVFGMVLVATIVVARGESTERLVALLGVMALAVVRVMPSAVRILGALNEIRYYAATIQALHDDLSAAEPDRPAGGPMPPPREIRLSNVSYTYPGAKRASLDGVSLTIARGESVALIGSSGAGKTTLADVVIGLLEPTEGTIEIDGERLRPELRRSWQRTIGYIPQQVYLGDDTLRRNVAFGVPDDAIDDDRLARALERARLSELVRSLPEGLETIVGERGVRLSGGQRQRIGIARALYLDPAVLVLDEATSALDGITEAEVVEAIEVAAADRTTIVIAHRLSTVRKCDRLIYMSDGKIVNSGSWDTLLAANVDFRRLVELTNHG